MLHTTDSFFVNGIDVTKAIFTTDEFAKLVNRKPSTLYEWAYSKKLVPHKDASGRNIYLPEHYKQATGLDLPRKE